MLVDKMAGNRRREHLVIREVRDAGEHIRVAPSQGKAGLIAHTVSSPVFRPERPVLSAQAEGLGRVATKTGRP